MNVDELMSNLKYVLIKATEKLQLKSKSGSYIAPKIATGYLPTKKPKSDQEDIPCIIARFLGDETTDDGSIAKVKIICIAYSQDDEQGWRDLLTIMNPLQTYFLAHRNIGDCYKIALPINRNIPEEQVPPEWAGTFRLSIEIPTVQEVDKHVTRFLNGSDQ